MLKVKEAAERIDRCLFAFTRGHQKPDCLRQDLIQELLAVYEHGVKDERAACVAQREKTPKTKRQAEILEYYLAFKERHGHIPSYQQIGNHLGGIQRATVAKHVKALRRQGFTVDARS